KVLEEIHFDGILVLDTGFSSQDLAEIMRMEMKFIMPLRRNQEIIDYNMEMRSSFVYRDSGIRSGFLNAGTAEDIHVPGPDTHGGRILDFHKDDCRKEKNTEGIRFRIPEIRKDIHPVQCKG
ncbi:hypothetical protein B1B_02262, partial [mine drainage metagenome]